MTHFQAQPPHFLRIEPFSHLSLAGAAHTSQALIHQLYERLTSVACNLEAAVRWLERDVPDIAQARAALSDTLAAARDLVAVSAALSVQCAAPSSTPPASVSPISARRERVVAEPPSPLYQVQ
ncbi:hypothetical protein [Pseudomonas sp. RIT-PI-S]|uniref:hypothetical protein n=1 Tax=Pseudomonas sp. RIT-PI-S TaxID=3035295 RepID=UPI0021D90F65|nr:hypothetical protein [Pseudomonas sp. RIT-PI-S]